MPASATTFTLDGIEARPVRVEVDLHRGLPAFSIVGLPDAAVRESRERVRSALVNSGFEFALQRITVNLAPADLRKAGPGLDLAIAAALLAASGQIPSASLGGLALAGELALTGEVRPVSGVLAMAEAASAAGIPALAVAARNAPEAALVEGVRALAIDRLQQVAALASGRWSPPSVQPLPIGNTNGAGPDLADLAGQPELRYALEVSAAGGHSLLMLGSPGAGKSLAARRLPSILPPLDGVEAIEVARIASACGSLAGELPGRPPFRAPHHTISFAGLVGGGNPPRPGEVTLAHRGVLFLDEISEFRRDALEALRAPLEDGVVSIARAGRVVELPCRFVLVAAANPCPCGRGADDARCSCPAHIVQRYQARLSGALADRIDIRIPVRPPSAEAMQGRGGERSAEVRGRVLAARERQRERLGEGRRNAEMTRDELRAMEIERDARRLLAHHHARNCLSGRGHDRVMRLARTIADLASAGRIEVDHMAVALHLRNPEADG